MEIDCGVIDLSSPCREDEDVPQSLKEDGQPPSERQARRAELETGAAGAGVGAGVGVGAAQGAQVGREAGSTGRLPTSGKTQRSSTVRGGSGSISRGSSSGSGGGGGGRGGGGGGW